MQSEFDRVVLAREKVAEAQAGYALACDAMAAGLIGEIAALPAERIGRAAAQMRIALADAAAGAGDVRARQAWHVLALRNGTPLPEDKEEDETEIVLRLARAPSEADVAVLEGLGLKPARATVVGYRGRCGLAALAPLIERYDGSVQDGSGAALAPLAARPRQHRRDDGPGEADARVPAKARSSAMADISDAAVVDAVVVPASIGAEAPGQAGRFVPRAPLPTRAGERRSGGDGMIQPVYEPASEPEPDGDGDADHYRGEGDLR